MRKLLPVCLLLLTQVEQPDQLDHLIEAHKHLYECCLHSTIELSHLRLELQACETRCSEAILPDCYYYGHTPNLCVRYVPAPTMLQFWSHFASNMTGPDTPYNVGTAPYDFDFDGHIDLKDVHLWLPPTKAEGSQP